MSNRLESGIEWFGKKGMLPIQVIRVIWTIDTLLGPVGNWKARVIGTMLLQSHLSLSNIFQVFFPDNRGVPINEFRSIETLLKAIEATQVPPAGQVQ